MTARELSFVKRCLAPYLFLLAILSINGCASYSQSRAILQTPPSGLSSIASLNNVPFVAQEKYFCGPSAMSMMLQTQGVNLPLESLIGMIYVPESQGSFQVELIAAARRVDLVPYVLAPRMASILQEIDSGNPVLVLQNLGLPSNPVWHYAVVVGYDLKSKTVTLHSGLEARKEIAIGTFERTWANYSESWALVMLPPNKLPATATPLGFQKAIEDLVSIGKSSLAFSAYKSALLKWPETTHLHTGLGNLYYQSGDFRMASENYSNAISADPNAANAWNNLAYALAKQGCENAISAATCATKLQPQTDSFSSTMSDVQGLLQTHVPTNHGTQAKSCLRLAACPDSSNEDKP